MTVSYANRVERLRWIGANVELWPSERVRAVLPSRYYFSAAHYPRAFHIHPLNYALGLAAAAEQAGARIFEDTPAVAIDAAGVRKRIVTPGGRVRASHVVLAGNVHLGLLMPRLAATLMPITSYVMDSEPIGPLLHDVIRYRGAVTDGVRADNHYRIVGDTNSGGERLQWAGRMRVWPAEPRRFARALLADVRRNFPNSAKSISRTCGRARSAARCITCRRLVPSSPASGWQAASAGTGSTPRPWPAN